MPTSFIPYGRQNIDQADIDAVVAVLKSDYLTQGPAVAGFESSLSEFLGRGQVVSVANGTAGLHIACLAAGLTAGDAVIVPAMSFAATANAVLYCGATPVFADLEPKTSGLSVASVRAALALARTKKLRPKAIIMCHYAGLPGDMPALRSLANEHDLVVIEDACHALGAEYRASLDEAFTKVGTGKFSDMCVFSFHPVKHLTTGEGGAVTTNNDSLLHSLRLLRSHGITKDPQDFVISSRAFDERSPSKVNSWYMEMQTLGYNYRLCDVQAALGKSQISRLAQFVARRRAIASAYDAAFLKSEYMAIPPGDSEFAKHSYHLYSLRLDFDKIGKSRQMVMEELRSQGVGSQVHYLPIFWHPYYQSHRDSWLQVETPHAERFYAQELSLPMYPGLSDAMVQQVVRAVQSVVGR